MKKIQMVDLKSQYLRIKPEIDKAIFECIENAQFIKGKPVEDFQNALAKFLNVEKVISCANGTDALQIALMALELKPGDEVIVPAFTYVSTAEVIGLLGLTPVIVDVDPDTFNIDIHQIEKAYNSQTKLVVPVHLFGQCTDMEPIIDWAKSNNVSIVEDTAQALGATYSFADGSQKAAGGMGDIGTTSFFPSKNLGCFGDGGAIYTNEIDLAEKLRMIANHGQPKQYTHDIIGVNSRLDTIQAAILNVKLKYLDEYASKRQEVAKNYDQELGKIDEIQIPTRQKNSTHVFHQYTLKVKNGRRDTLKAFLASKEIPSMIYYPMPLNEQKAFKSISRINGDLKNSKKLCSEVLSLPMHTEMQEDEQTYIIDQIKSFFNG